MVLSPAACGFQAGWLPCGLAIPFCFLRRRTQIAEPSGLPADWIIELGPESGDAGGKSVAGGTPEEVAGGKKSYTGRYSRKVLSRQTA